MSCIIDTNEYRTVSTDDTLHPTYDKTESTEDIKDDIEHETRPTNEDLERYAAIISNEIKKGLKPNRDLKDSKNDNTIEAYDEKIIR